MDRHVDRALDHNKSTDNMQASLQAKAASRSFVKSGQKSPDAFLTISEVADELGLQQHVLRFWETKFSQIKPMKRAGGRRYYRPDDVILLKNIRYLLYADGYTIKGVQKLLKSEGRKFLTQKLFEDDSDEVSGVQQEAPQPAPALPQGGAHPLTRTQQDALSAMLAELKALRAFVDSQ